MNHDKIQQKLNDYADNELTAADMQIIRAHLMECGACADEVFLMNQISRLLPKRTPPPPSDAFVAAVMARINASEKTLPRRWFAPALGFGFAAFLFLLVFSSLEQHFGTEDLLMPAGTTDQLPGSDVESLLLPWGAS